MRGIVFGLFVTFVGVGLMLHGALKAHSRRADVVRAARRRQMNEEMLTKWRANRPSEDTIKQWWQANGPRESG